MAVEQLASADLPCGSKHIGQERSHLFTGCGHSVEKDNCMFPPSHTSTSITLNSGSDNVVKYEGYCSNCEYKRLIPRAIMAGTKKHVAASLPSDMEVKIEGKPKYGPSQVTLQFASKDKTSTDETNEWTKFPVTVTPQLVGNSVRGARQWEYVYVDIDNEKLSFVAMEFIQEKLEEYERKWNELPVRTDVANVGEQQRQSNRPQMAEVMENDFELFQNYFKYGDPDFFEEMESIPEFGSSV